MFKYKEKTAYTLQLQYLYAMHMETFQTVFKNAIVTATLFAACFPFEKLEKCMTFKDIYPGLSRSWYF